LSAYQLESTLEADVLSKGFHQPYTGSATDNVNFPLGTPVLVGCNTRGYTRNKSNAICLGVNDCVFNDSVYAGTSLSGVWRARGLSPSSSPYFILFERTE